MPILLYDGILILSQLFPGSLLKHDILYNIKGLSTYISENFFLIECPTSENLIDKLIVTKYHFKMSLLRFRFGLRQRKHTPPAATRM